MVNVSKSVIKAVTRNKRNWLTRLNQKGTKGSWENHTNPTRLQNFPAESRHLTRYYSNRGTWKPCISLLIGDSRSQDLPMGMQVWEVGKSEGQFVVNWIQV